LRIGQSKPDPNLLGLQMAQRNGQRVGGVAWLRQFA
jgi:hypothetical protein